MGINALKKAFTVVELLISLVIVSLIGAGVMLMMSRGASNVQRGSYVAQASSQAAWIVASLRKDITNSGLGKLNVTTGWNGKKPLKIQLNNGEEILYKIVKKGRGKALMRQSSAKRKRFFAVSYLKSIDLDMKDGLLNLNITLQDPEKKGKDIAWNALISVPSYDAKDNFWKPLK